MARKTGRVLVARGKEWELYWPRDEWEGLTAAEQQAVRDRQAALLEGTETETRRPGRPRRLPRPAAAPAIIGVFGVTK